jgi:hypothetical protein
MEQLLSGGSIGGFRINHAFPTRNIAGGLDDAIFEKPPPGAKPKIALAK